MFAPSSSLFSRSRSYSSQSSTAADGTKFGGTTSLAPMPLKQRVRSGSTRSITANAEDMVKSVSAAAGTTRVVGWSWSNASPAASLNGHASGGVPDAAASTSTTFTSPSTAPPSTWTSSVAAARRPSSTSVEESRMRSQVSTPDVLSVYTAPNSPDVAPSELSEMDHLLTITAPTSPAYHTIDMPTDFLSANREGAQSPPVDEQGQLRAGGARITLTPNSSRPVSRTEPPPPPPVPPKSPRHQTFGAAGLPTAQAVEVEPLYVPSSGTFGNLSAASVTRAAVEPMPSNAAGVAAAAAAQAETQSITPTTAQITPSTSGWSVETDPASAAPSGVVTSAHAAPVESGAPTSTAATRSKPPIPPASSRTRALHAIRARSGNFSATRGGGASSSLRGLARPVSTAAIRRRYSADHLGAPSYRRGTFVPLGERSGATPRLGTLRVATSNSTPGSVPGSPMRPGSLLEPGSALGHGSTQSHGSALGHGSSRVLESAKALDSPVGPASVQSHKPSSSTGTASVHPLQAALWVAGGATGTPRPTSPLAVSLPATTQAGANVSRTGTGSRAGSVVQGRSGAPQTWMVDGQYFEDPPAGSPLALSTSGWPASPIQLTAVGLHEDTSAQPKQREEEREEVVQPKPRAASVDTLKGLISNRNRSDTLTSTGSTLSKFSSWSKSARKTASGGFKSSHSSQPSAHTYDGSTAKATQPEPANHEDAVDDSPATDENGNAPSGAYAIRPPSHDELEQAASLKVMDENGQSIPFGQLFAQRRTIFCFLRHWLCPFCQMFTESLRFIDPLPLERAGLDLIVIGQGHWHVTKAYKEVMGVPAWIQMYSDPSRKIYKVLGMTLRTNDAGPACARPDYQTRGAFKGTMVAMKRGVWDMPLRPPGDLKLLGGEFILGPGLQVSFTHRMVTVRDHMDLRRVLVQAGCDMSLKTPVNVLEERETSSKPGSTRSLGRKRSAAAALKRFGRKSSTPVPPLPKEGGGSQQDLRIARSSLSRPGIAKTAPRMPTLRTGLLRSALVAVDTGDASIATRPNSQGSTRAGYAASAKDVPTDYGDKDYRYEADNSLPPARRPSTANSTSRNSVAGAPSPAFAMAIATSGTMSPLLAVAAERTAAAASGNCLPRSFSSTSLVQSVSGSLAPRPLSSTSVNSERPPPFGASTSRPGSALSKLRQAPLSLTSPLTPSSAQPVLTSRPSTASGTVSADTSADKSVDSTTSLSRNRASGLPLSLFESRILGSTANKTSVDGTPLQASPVIGSNTSFSNAGAAPAPAPAPAPAVLPPSPLVASVAEKQAASPVTKTANLLAVEDIQRSVLTPISDAEDIESSDAASPVPTSTSKISSGALPPLPVNGDDDEDRDDYSDSESDSEHSARDINRSSGALSSRSGVAAAVPFQTPTLGTGLERVDAGFGGSFLDDLDDVDGFGSRTPGSNVAPTPDLSTLYEGDSSDDDDSHWPKPVGPAPVETAAYSDDSDREGIEPNRWDGDAASQGRDATSIGSRSAASTRSNLALRPETEWRDEDDDSSDSEEENAARSPAVISAPGSESGRSPYQAAADGRATHAPLHGDGEANDDVDSLDSGSDGSFSGDEFEGSTSQHVQEAEIRTASYRAPPHRLYKASSFSRLPSRRLSAFMEEDEEEEEEQAAQRQEDDIEEDYEDEDDVNEDGRSELSQGTREECSSPTWTEPLRASAPASPDHNDSVDLGPFGSEAVEPGEQDDKPAPVTFATVDDGVHGVLDGDLSDETSEATPLARPLPLPEVDLRA